MIGPALHQTVLPALLIGTARQPLRPSGFLGGVIPGDDPKASLKLLALAGQALRFERPAVPASFTANPDRAGARPLVPEELRPTVVRLFGDGKGCLPASDDLAFALALALENLQLQPHPFDFPRLEGFLRAHAERLGPEACAWVDRTKPIEEKRGYFDLAVLDDGNWNEATPARRQRYIVERRRQDADAGRALVETAWAGLNADLRMKLLEALRSGLSRSDRSFLEGLANDRSPRVRQLAERFLAKLPSDGDGQAPAINNLLGRIIRGQSGLLRRRPTLKLELPATIDTGSATAWIGETVAGITIGAFSRAVAIPEMELAAAAAGDQTLILALALMATDEARCDLLATIAGSAQNSWSWLLGGAFEGVESLDLVQRSRWAEALFDPARAETRQLPLALSILLRHLEQPVTEPMMAALLRSAAWRDGMNGQSGAASLGTAAAICPPGCRPMLRSTLGQLAPGDAGPALQYLDLVEQLEKVRQA